MTLPEAMALMLRGSGSPTDTFDKINQIRYVEYSTTVQDCIYDGTEYTYGTVIQVPDNSIIISRQDRWITDDGKTAYSYSYHPFSVLISNLGTVNEHVYGIKDLLTDKVYHLEVVE